MSKANSFEVSQVVISDYVTNDAQGQPIYVGVHHGDLAFAVIPHSWPMIYLSAIIIPKSDRFNFQVKITKPNNDLLLQFRGEYKSDRLPKEIHKLNLNWQIPPGNFTGVGVYWLDISEAGRSVFGMPINVFVSNEPPLEVSVRIDMVYPGPNLKVGAG